MLNKPIKSKNYFPKLEDRIVQAKLISKKPGLLSFKIPNLDFIEEVRVSDHSEEQNSSPEIYNNFNTGDLCEIFLINHNQQNPNIWYGSYKWRRIEENPWFFHNYSLGDLVIGEATEFVEDTGVIIQLKDGIEAYLNKEELIGLPFTKGDNIQKIIHIGDTVCGEIIQFSQEYLEIQISVRKMYERKKTEFKLLKKRGKNRLSISKYCLSDSNKNEYPSGTRLLVIDDNIFFRKRLKYWLDFCGVENEIISEKTSLSYIRNLLSQNEWHILLDYDLGDPEFEKDIITTLNDQKKVMLCSPNGEATELAIAHPGWLYSSKPFSTDILDSFLRDQEYKLQTLSSAFKSHNISRARAVKLWDNEFPEMADLGNRIEEFLMEVAIELNFSCSMWIKLEREGLFKIYVQTGLNLSKNSKDIVESSLIYTPVKISLEAGEIIFQNIKKSHKILKSIAPPKTKYVVAFPFSERDQKYYSRVLFFFSNSDISQSKKIQEIDNYLKKKLSYIHLLIDNQTLIEQANNIRAFAPLGMATAGIAHELANRIEPLQSTIEGFERIGERAKKDKDFFYSTENYFEKILSDMKNAIKGMNDIISDELLLVRKKKTEFYNLIELVERVANIMSYFGTGKKGNQVTSKNILIKLELPEEEILSTNLPQQNIEQPLINLIANAFFQLQEQGWGCIIIRLNVNAKDPLTPIHIEVIDNGCGINAFEKSKLFEPRQTSRSQNGNGLGLFLSRKLVRLINGEIENKYSIRWSKTSFIIKLPSIFMDRRTN